MVYNYIPGDFCIPFHLVITQHVVITIAYNMYMYVGLQQGHYTKQEALQRAIETHTITLNKILQRGAQKWSGHNPLLTPSISSHS